MLRSPILDTLIMEVLIPPKRRLLQEQHDVSSQKTAFFRFGALKHSNLTSQMLVGAAYLLRFITVPVILLYVPKTVPLPDHF
jgi:hypothetical protein